MSDFVYSQYTDPPTDGNRKDHTFKEIYLKSLQKQNNTLKKCRLCLLYSPDCSHFRCHNSSHLVCEECACDWQSDKLCPVCKNATPTITKTSTKSTFSRQNDDEKHILMSSSSTKRLIAFQDLPDLTVSTPENSKKTY